jgi:hypothetical protein
MNDDQRTIFKRKDAARGSGFDDHTLDGLLDRAVVFPDVKSGGSGAPNLWSRRGVRTLGLTRALVDAGYLPRRAVKLAAAFREPSPGRNAGQLFAGGATYLICDRQRGARFLNVPAAASLHSVLRQACGGTIIDAGQVIKQVDGRLASTGGS